MKCKLYLKVISREQYWSYNKHILVDIPVWWAACMKVTTRKWNCMGGGEFNPVCLLMKEFPHFLYFCLLKVFHRSLLNWEKPYCTPLFLSFFQYNMDKAIVDSGTTLLRLPVNVFNAVVEAITRSSLVRCRLSTDNDETCCQSKEMQGRIGHTHCSRT